MLGGIAPPPKQAWLLVLIGAALLSAFEVARAADGGVTVSFKVTPITAALIAFLWLPTFIRVWALGGGSVKTPAGEASFAALPLELLRALDPDTQREALSNLIAVADAVEAQTPATAVAVRSVRAALEEDLAALAPDTRVARKQVAEYAERYRALRKTPSGRRRTWEMTRVIGAARAVAPQARFTFDELQRAMRSDDEGERIVALAAIQAAADLSHLELALEAVDHSKSPFEQYHGLTAVQRMLERLNPAERERVRSVIERQRSGAPDTWITTDDRSRWDLSTRILAALPLSAAHNDDVGAR